MPYPSSSPEFPDYLRCHILPQHEEASVEVEFYDYDANQQHAVTTPHRIRYLPVPVITHEQRKQLGSHIEKTFIDNTAGVGLIACRCVNTSDDMVAVDIPTLEDRYRVLVNQTQVLPGLTIET